MKCKMFALMCRELVTEYNEQVMKLCSKLMKVFSLNLGLKEDHLENEFGGEQIGAALRANFYPRCPQPDLTLGISPHSDPGVITILLPDDHVSGLQIRKDDAWVRVKPIPNAFIINLADQLQVSNFCLYICLHIVIYVHKDIHICMHNDIANMHLAVGDKESV